MFRKPLFARGRFPVAENPVSQAMGTYFQQAGRVIRLVNEIPFVLPLCDGCFGVRLPRAAILFGSPASTCVRGILPQPTGR